jgi:hypothetical protein
MGSGLEWLPAFPGSNLFTFPWPKRIFTSGHIVLNNKPSNPPPAINQVELILNRIQIKSEAEAIAMVARAFVAKRFLDQYKIGRIAKSDQWTGRGDPDEQLAA